MTTRMDNDNKDGHGRQGRAWTTMRMGDRYGRMATTTGRQVQMDGWMDGHTRVATRTVSTLVRSPPLLILLFFSHPPSLSLSPLCSPPLSPSCSLLLCCMHSLPHLTLCPCINKSNCN